MASWFSGEVVSNGIRIHYYRTGGNKPPIVLAHGLTDAGLCWTHVAQELEADYDLVMYDARGHSLSEAPDQGYSADDMAADLFGVTEALSLVKPVLIGHSMGAEVAAVAAATYPDLARGVVLSDPPWHEASSSPAEQQTAAEGWRKNIAYAQSQTLEKLLAYVRQRSPTWPEVELRPWAEAKLQVSPQAAQFVSTARRPWREVARAIACPVLLITGDVERGAIVAPELPQEAAGLFRQGTVVRIANAGHNIHREQFAAFMQAVRAFLVTL